MTGRVRAYHALMRTLVLAVLGFAAALSVSARAQEASVSDPYAWMEEIEGVRPLEWARAENARSLPRLQNDPRYAKLYGDALAIATAKDRIPGVYFEGGALRNFWQDAEHVRGIWRATTLEGFKGAATPWETILDLDALSKAENANWVWHGAACLPPEERYCLVSLSDGGKDADTVREFDTVTKTFVEGGFVAPEGKQTLSWIDRDTVLVSRDWGDGTVTESGYPFVVKLWRRGQPLADAKELYRGTKTDVSVDPFVLRDADGVVRATMARRGVSFFETEYVLLDGPAPVKLPLPLQSTVQGLVAGQMVLTLEQDWPEQGMRSGDLVSLDLAALKADPAKARATLVLRPNDHQAIEQVATTRNRLVVALYEDVKGKLFSYAHGAGGWTSAQLATPPNSSVAVQSASDHDDRILFTATGYLTPTVLSLGDAASLAAEPLKTSPARFDAKGMKVEQFWATSKDGTRVPYFVVHKSGLKRDGSNPTLLYAYGGFQVSETPRYSGMIGKLWLERGGVFVDANIRGGGEFGPRWHQAGLKANRQKVFDDYFAVAQDLIDRKITSPRRLGAMGGSNGGLLMGVAMTQRPDLFGAIVIQVPLLDMLGYTHIGAGASWVGEYGDPAIPAERQVLEAYSPYQNLKAGQGYPLVFLETSTKDDRVHPAHARKFGARLHELGYDYLYYENIDGGHAAAANLNETAVRNALEFTYLTQRLMD